MPKAGVALPGSPGFFIPHRYAATAAPRAYPALDAWFHAAEGPMRRVLDAVATRLDRIATGAPPPSPRWEQDWFPRLDGATAYTMVQTIRPQRIVEVGSGHSTRFMAKAIKDAGLGTRLTCIDPAPRASLSGLEVEHLAHLLSADDVDLVRTLEAGDILFIDSSHIAMPGSDVDLIVGELLPRLRPGIVVHFHDILLPDPYPKAWAWRSYNEQIAIAALLQGGAYELLFSSHWIVTRRSEWLREAGLDTIPLRPGAVETSLWLRKQDQATITAS